MFWRDIEKVGVGNYHISLYTCSKMSGHPLVIPMNATVLGCLPDRDNKILLNKDATCHGCWTQRNTTIPTTRKEALTCSTVWLSNQPLADWICSLFRKQEFTSGILNLVTGLLGGCCCCSAKQTWCVHPTALHMYLCPQICGAGFDQRSFFLQRPVVNSKNS